MENISKHRDALRQNSKAVEKFFPLIDDPAFFWTSLVPDVESFYWANPQARAMAFEYWGM